MVEFALVLPVLCLFLFGIVDFGNTYFQLQSLRHGVQEGARIGVVPAQSTPPWPGTTNCGLTGVSAGTTTDVQDLMCAVKSEIGLGTQTRVAVVFASGPGGTVTPTTWTVPTAAQPNGGALVVCAAAPLSSVSGFFISLFKGKYMTSKTEYAIESSLPSGVTEHAGAETDPTGQSWSWCTP
jgi:TadE-like protein